MKKILTILTLIFACTFINAQEETIGGELSIRIINNPNEDTIRIILELVSSLCWDAIGEVGYYDVHDLTNLYTGTTILEHRNDQLVEFHACWDRNLPPHLEGRQFGLGLYKVTCSLFEIPPNTLIGDNFIIDYRTSDLPENFGQGDLLIDFDASRGKFYYPGTQDEFPNNNTIWGLKEWMSDIKDELEPLPPENFQLSAGSSIQLSWSHSSNTDHWRTGYAIYRSVVGGCGTPAGSFTKIATLSASATSYTDNNFSSGGTLTAYYKVATINGTRESEFTPTLNACVQVGMQKLKGEESIHTYSLSQNYPNPFNPTTYISFSLEENSFVSLKVYDMLGRETATLVEGYKEAGNHSNEFNAEGLESGIYFYEIKAGKFRDVKKLILLK